jgi:small conductance mechanosensitive channel
VIAVCLGIWIQPALGQLSLPSPFGSSPQTNSLPSGVERSGIVETAPVYFENRVLFRVTSPTVWNRVNLGNQILVEARAEQVAINLQQIIALEPDSKPIDARRFNTAFDPQTLRVEVVPINGQTALQARDAYHPQPQDLLTITELDAKFYRLTVAELAQQRQKQLQSELVVALQARLPQAIMRHVLKAAQIIGVASAANVLLWLLQRRMRRLSKTLQAQQDASHVAAESEATHPFHFLDRLRHRFSLERRHSLNSLLRWLLLWAQVLLWIFCLTHVLSIFPQTQALSDRVWTTPVELVLIWFATGALNRLGDVLINRFSHVLEDQELFTFENMQRKCLRLSTLIRVTKGVKTFCIYVVGTVWALNLLGVPISSVLTVGAVLALAVSLASQSLIKDLVNGILILSEDQYGIGDFISVGNATGLVENMNLRITQLRNAEGRLITIPNSLISRVENLTRIWSRVDFTIEVAYDANLKVALAVLEQVCQQMYVEPQWQALLVKPPEVLGIEHLSHAGASIRVWLQTQPLQQWKVGRNFRLRVWSAFAEHNIEIGVPQQIFRHGNGSSIDAGNGAGNLQPEDSSPVRLET